MRLLLTALASTGPPRDVAVDVPDDATVGDVAAALAPVAAPEPAAVPVPVTVPDGAGAAEAGPGVPAGPPRRPVLVVSGVGLDPDAPVATSPLRHGVVVGLDVAAPDVLREPFGAIEIHVCGGPGSGVVHRLDVGEYTVGADATCDIVLSDPGLPGLTGVLAIAPGGHVEIRPAQGVAGAVREAPVRRSPLPAPIVLRAGPRRPRRRPGARTPDGVTAVRPDEAVPLLHLQRHPVAGPTPWPHGEILAVGDVLLSVQWSRPPDAPLRPNPRGATLDLSRPPRLLPAQRQTEFALPPEPPAPDRTPLPVLMVLLPILLGLGLWWLTRTTTSVVFLALTPLMAIGTYVTARRLERGRYLRAFAEWEGRTRRVHEAALAALTEEGLAWRADCPDPAQILLIAAGPRSRLWQRRLGDPDALVVRVGTADQPSEVTVQDPGREAHERGVMWTTPDAPVTVPLLADRVLGIAGPATDRTALARSVLGQLVTLHNPADLRLVLLSRHADPESWAWLRWLPHARGADGDGPPVLVGTDADSLTRRVVELQAEVAARAGARAGTGTAATAGDPGAEPPIVVVLDGARDLRLVPGVAGLLDDGPDVGFLFVCLDDDERLLPEECRAVVRFAGSRLSVRRTGRPEIEAVRPDLVSRAWAERLARGLAPVRDVSGAADVPTLPDSARLLPLLRLSPPTPKAVAARWAEGPTTAAVVGEGVDGPFTLDLQRDGPHVLVAGTTGSGKSELLQTLVAALAAANRPDAMTFVLVDYKGGAAFRDCARLPHTLGVVTDLDGHLTGRALDSLAAELRRRERVLAASGASDLGDHAGRPGAEPLARLVIVVDEFAALVAELPDFVSGLVDIARRGRSLGVHLVLATQRPAGVVGAEIRANTNLRIALRVTDRHDSVDVVSTPDAAHIAKTTPGRAFARIGHARPVPFQAAWAGAPAGGEVRAAATVRGLDLWELGRDGAGASGAWGAAAHAPQPGGPTDLSVLVDAIDAACTRLGVSVPRSPWLPPLPDVVTLDELVRDHPEAGPTPERLVLPLGLSDVPAAQRREVATLDLDRGGHLAVVGGLRSGRSGVLRALAGAVAAHVSPEDVHLYGVDCGNNALLPLVALPHTGAVVTREESERMDRLAARLSAEVARRQEILALEGYADVAEQRAAAPPGERLPYLLVLLDRWDGLVQVYEPVDSGRLVAAWQQLLQEGTGVGLRFVVTGDRGLTLGRMAMLLPDKLLLRTGDPTDYAAIGMTRRQVPVTMPDGRGFRADGLKETQVAALCPDLSGTAQVARLQRWAREAETAWADVPAARRAFRVDALPPRVSWADAARLAGLVLPASSGTNGAAGTSDAPGTNGGLGANGAAGHAGPTGPAGLRRFAGLAGAPGLPEGGLPFAVGGDTLAVRCLDADVDGPGALVTGPRRSGRSGVLLALAQAALVRGWRVAVVAPRVSPLRDLGGTAGVLGPWTSSTPAADVRSVLSGLLARPGRSLVLVDDLEVLEADAPISDILAAHLDSLRDSGSLLVAAGTPNELAAMYRGPVLALKRSGTGVMLSPSSGVDLDLFGARLPRSALGARLPAGGGYLLSGGLAERIQCIWAPSTVQANGRA